MLKVLSHLLELALEARRVTPLVARVSSSSASAIARSTTAGRRMSSFNVARTSASNRVQSVKRERDQLLQLRADGLGNRDDPRRHCAAILRLHSVMEH